MHFIKLSKQFFVSPLFCIFVGIFVYIYVNYGILSGNYIFSHDTFYWFAFFKYFAEALYSGFLPLWNPYSHGGEMFFQYIGIWALLDPINLIGLLLGKLFNIQNLMYLYELITLAKILFIATGIQLLLNYMIPELKKLSYFTFFVILLSSFSIHNYHQNGLLLSFSYTPYILLFLLRFFDKPTWFNTIVLGYLSGLCFQSMHFYYNSTFILIFLILYFIVHRDKLKIIIDKRLNIFVIFIIFIILSFPAWVLIFYKSSIYPYARFLFNPLEENPPVFFANFEQFKYSLAGFGSISDLLTLGILPLAIMVFRVQQNCFSEAETFIGLIPFILGILGLIKGKSNYKSIFFILLLISIILFLGPQEYNLFYALLFYVLPPLRGIENSHLFISYFLLCYFYFFSLGLVFIYEKLIHKKLIATLFFITLIELFVYGNQLYANQVGSNLIPTQRIYNYNIESFKPDEFKTLLSYIHSEDNKKRLLTSYKKTWINHKDYTYNIIPDLSVKERKNIKLILSSLITRPLNLNKITSFTIGPRQKIILPLFLGIYTPWEVNNLKIYYYNLRLRMASNSTADMMNFRGLVEHKSVAYDFYKNLDYRKLVKLLPPTSITYPKLYANILKANIPDVLKDELLGVHLPVFSVYQNYKIVSDKKILNPEDSKEIIEDLQKNVLLSNVNNSSLLQLSHINKEEVLKTQIKIISYQPDKIKLSVQSNNKGILLFRDGFDPHWVAKVNGKKQTIMQGNYISKAIIIDKGLNIVEFSYNPILYKLALLVYLLGSLSFLAYIIVFYITRRSIKKEKS